MRPREAVVAVTYRCNSRCSMCNIWKADDHDEMDPKEYAKLPRSLKTINVTGGEPFLRKDLTEVMKVIHGVAPDARIVFSTNGFLTDVILAKVAEIRAFHPNIGVGISIDGLEDVHDKIRGIPGMFKRAIATVQGLKAAGVKDLRIGLTIVRENVSEVRHVFDLSRELGVEFTTTIAHNSDIYFRKTDNDALHPAPGELEPLDYVRRSLLRSASVKNWFRAYHVNGIIDPSVRTHFHSHCEAGRRYFFLAPNGDVYPCNVLDEVIGNLAKSSSWDEIYPRDAQARVRSAVKSCRRDCWMVCNTRSLVMAHPFKVGAWVAINKIRAHMSA
jgi:radical SAM protein with 4Fe4S-binding SPASM domain